MRNPAGPTAHSKNLDLSLKMVFAVNRMTSESAPLLTVRTPPPGKQAPPLIFETRNAIVFCRNIE